MVIVSQKLEIDVWTEQETKSESKLNGFRLVESESMKKSLLKRDDVSINSHYNYNTLRYIIKASEENPKRPFTC